MVNSVTKQVLLTPEGLQKLQDELDYLKTVKRKEVTEAIKVALSFGDLSENSEYDEAKNEQAKMEHRVSEIEAMLKNVKIIDENEIDTTVVSVGSKVKVRDIEAGKVAEYTIVGSTESDPMDYKISDESPVGAALLGHKAGQKVKVSTPSGELEFKIISISR